MLDVGETLRIALLLDAKPEKKRLQISFECIFSFSLFFQPATLFKVLTIFGSYWHLRFFSRNCFRRRCPKSSRGLGVASAVTIASGGSKTEGEFGANLWNQIGSDRGSDSIFQNKKSTKDPLFFCPFFFVRSLHSERCSQRGFHCSSGQVSADVILYSSAITACQRGQGMITHRDWMMIMIGLFLLRSNVRRFEHSWGRPQKR